MGTWPRYERRVERALAQHGFDFYLPRYKTRHQRVALLFPRHLYRAGGAMARIAKYLRCEQIAAVGCSLPLVPDECVAALRAREDHQGFVKLPRRAPRFRVGQRVRITLGVFTGLSGIYRGGKRNREPGQ